MTKVFDNQPATIYPITDSTRRKLAVALEDPEAANELVGAIDAARDNESSIILPGEDFRKGAIGPTDTTIGSTPTIHVLNFDAVTELLSGHTFFPIGMDLTYQLTYELQVMLANPQSDGDVLDMAMDYVVVRENETGAGFDKTSTHLETSTTFTTENGLAVNDIYHIHFTIPVNDSDNPLEGADGIGVEFHLANLTDVASINFAQARIRYRDLLFWRTIVQ